MRFFLIVCNGQLAVNLKNKEDKYAAEIETKNHRCV